MDPSSEKPTTWQGEPIPYDAPTSELRDRIRVPGPAAWAAFRALAARDTDEALAVLAEAAQSEDAFLRRAAVGTIAMHPRGAMLGVVVNEALRDDNEYVVRVACAAASLLELEETRDALRALLSHPTGAVREGALRALGTLWTPSDFGSLFRLFLEDPADEVREEATWVLRAHAAKEHWRELFDAWSRDALVRRRLWACEIAGLFGDASALPGLERLHADVDGHVRKAAERAIAALGERA